jgi:hypothetical protein
MVQRHGPPLRSLIFDKAIKADHVIRQEVADSHQGQKPNRFNQRPDRFMQPEPTVPIRIILRREASIDCRRSHGAEHRPEPGTPASAHRTASHGSAADKP